MGITSFYNNWTDAGWSPSALWGKYFGCAKQTARDGYQTAAIWYGLSRISGNIAMMELECYERDGRNVEARPANLSSYLLNRNPSPIYRPFTFKQTLQWHSLWHGNGRAYINRNGRQSELIVLDPTRTYTGMVNGEKYHCTYVKPLDNMVYGAHTENTPDQRIRLFEAMDENPDYTLVIPDADCFHIVGIGNGINGIPLWQAAKTSLESMLGADCRANEQITKGFLAKVVIKAPPGMLRDQKQAEEFMTDLVKKHGADGARRTVMLLREGLTAKTLDAMDNNQAQFLETRKYLREDAALWLLLENMLGIEGVNSFASLEQRQLAYLLNCLDPWLVRWEEEADFKLLSGRQFDSGNWHH